MISHYFIKIASFGHYIYINCFYGCSDYPTCDFVSWEMPLSEKCPKCGSYLTGKKIYNNLRKKCSNTSCDFAESVKIEAKTDDKKEQN